MERGSEGGREREVEERVPPATYFAWSRKLCHSEVVTLSTEFFL